MNLTIHNFVNSKKKINKEYLCISHGGNNVCPKMSWNCIDNAKSYVIIMEDPDAVSVSNFVHLFLYIDIINNKSCNTLSHKLYFGKNSLNENSYHGPCAPKDTGVHRYIFTIYALNKKIKINKNNDKINGSKDFIDKLTKMFYKILSKESIEFKYSY
jgi:Raf kinase inhibitor-like YbhB/YbcL family protein